MMRRFLAALLCVILCLSMIVPASALILLEDGWPFVIRYGDRTQNMIAITVDDCFDLPLTRVIFEMSQELGVPITFFPLGCQLHEEDADLWQAIAASDCELGTHTFAHVKMGDMDKYGIYDSVGRSQEKLDSILGYHYPIRFLRPPYGNCTRNGSAYVVQHAIEKFGFKHVINWDVDSTDPRTALRQTQNGSILLYHARPDDVACLRTLIPALQEKGYHLVTLTELLGWEPNTIGGEPYVFDRKQFP